MTQACAPLELSFCIKQCILVFVIQLMVAIFWTADFLESDDPHRVDKYTYQPFTFKQTFISIISGILFQLTL